MIALPLEEFSLNSLLELQPPRPMNFIALILYPVLFIDTDKALRSSGANLSLSEPCYNSETCGHTLINSLKMNAAQMHERSSTGERS